MAFRINVTQLAKQDIRETVAYMRKTSPRAAEKWLEELNQIQLSLREMPARFAVIQEAETLGQPYRSVRHYSHRVVFHVDMENAEVHILRVYHGSRKPLEPDELETT